MDRDQDSTTTILEVQAYFSANRYLICRPIRSEVIKRQADVQKNLKLQVSNGYDTLFNKLNTHKDTILDEKDLLTIDFNTTFAWHQNTHKFVKKMCTSQYTINQINNIPIKISNETVTEILDSNKDGALSLQEFRQTGWFLNVTVKDL